MLGSFVPACLSGIVWKPRRTLRSVDVTDWMRLRESSHLLPTGLGSKSQDPRRRRDLAFASHRIMSILVTVPTRISSQRESPASASPKAPRT